MPTIARVLQAAAPWYFLLAAAGWLSAPLVAQSPQRPSFKSGIDLVQVDVIATDRDGNVLLDLRQNELHVFEDGAPQVIEAFDLVNLPRTQTSAPANAPASIEPDISSNAQPFQGRLYLLLIDDLNISVHRTLHARRAARLFVERYLQPGDLMAMVCTSGYSEASQGFTSSKRLLIDAIDKVMAQSFGASTVEMVEDYNRVGGYRPPEAPKRAEVGDTLKNLTTLLGSIQGRRKSILMISESVDASLDEDTQELLAAAARANVSFYTVDPRGLTQGSDDEIQIAAYPAGQPYGIGPGMLRTDLQKDQDGLRTLASNTGGFAITSTNDLAQAYERLVSETGSYYMLAYRSPSRADGQFHKIDVRVSRPGVSIRARAGHGTPKETQRPPSAIRAAFKTPLPESGVRLGVWAAPFMGSGSKAQVMLCLELPRQQVRFERDDVLTSSFIVTDQAGVVRASGARALRLSTLRANVRELVEANGVRFLNRIDLAPGRYQLRFVTEHSTGTIGAVTHDFDVPNFQKPELSMSGLVVTSRAASQQPVGSRTNDDLTRRLEAAVPPLPAALRRFAHSDEIIVFGEVYQRGQELRKPMTVAASVARAHGGVVFSQVNELPAGERHRQGYSFSIHAGNFPPGDYVLTVRAQVEEQSTVQSTRQVAFTVTP